MKKIVFLTFILLCIIALFSCSNSEKPNPSNDERNDSEKVTETSIPVSVYIDGSLSQTIYTDATREYTVTPPEKPEDITTNPNAERYFYGWFVDSNFQTPLFDTTKFQNGGAIYGKWITVYSNSFQYTVDYGKATIVGFTDHAPTVLVIPAYVNSFPVARIGVDAFKDQTTIRTVILCNGIEEVGGFNGCNSIEKIEIPTSVTKIGDYGFANCGFYKFDIPSQISSIGYGAFEGCRLLTQVNLTNSVTSIGGSAFSGCTGLTSVVIPNSVTTIGEFAFSGCIGLTSVVIPNSVTTIGRLAFFCCTGLKSVSFLKGVTSIGASAFVGCTGLTSVSIPNSVTSIGGSAFSDCTSLSSVTIPNGVTSIGPSAFQGCTGLTSVTIPNSVNTIGESVFSNCSNLTNITIPFVGKSRNATGYESHIAYLFEGKKNYSSPKSGYYCIYFNSSSFHCYIPYSLKTVVLSEGINTIGDWMFHDCIGLTSVTIPNGVTSIGSSAFQGCTGLTSITIPDSVTSIGGSAFSGCSSLTSITIPDSVTSIGGSAFSCCSSLTSLTIPYIDKHLGYFFGAPSYEGYSNGRYYTQSEHIPSSLKTVVITGGTIIASCAFYDCNSLTSITIPNSVTSIGDKAFSYCSGLTNITIPNGVTSIGDSAFAYCSGLTNITIPNGVTSIGKYAFVGCSGLTSIRMPNSVTSIGARAFYGWGSFQTIYCQATSQPNAWKESDWDYGCSAKIVWGA